MKQVQKTRIGGFPTVNLEEALDMIKKSSSAGWEMPRETFASAIDSSAKSGPFLLKLAALRDFGLIERGDRIKFTLLAKQLIAPVTEEGTEYREKLKEAFLNSDVFHILYEKLREGSGEPTLTTIANLGMHEFGISPKRKLIFAKNFLNSGKFAGLLEEIEGGKVKVMKAGDIPDKAELEMTGFPSVTHILSKTNEVFSFRDNGIGWGLLITTAKPLDLLTRKKILEVIEMLEQSEKKKEEKKE